MGKFDVYKSFHGGENREPPVVNPVIQCEIQEPMERMVALQMLLDDRAHNFLARFIEDEVFLGTLDPNEEWRCWLEGDREASRLFFDDGMGALDDGAYDHFLEHYAEERKGIADELSAIEKVGRSLDEYQIFKTSLYNVFNNKNRLSFREYFDQIFSRAPDYGMRLDRHSKEDLDLLVTFQPLTEVNRGGTYYDYKLQMEFNPQYAKDGYVYSVRFLDAVSSDRSYVSDTNIPIYGRFSQFDANTNQYFLNAEHSLFYHEALKVHRMEEKRKYSIPADYFEATFIDTSKLVNFSQKSFQYGNSKVFIPKSQVAFAGENNEKMYMKRWLFFRLKSQIEEINQQYSKAEQPTLENTLSDAEQRCSCTGECAKEDAVSMETKGI